MTDIEQAYMILKGTWLDVSKMEIPDVKTPEDYLMEKDILRLLSNEALFLCKLIAGLPNEMYSGNDYNRVNWKKVYSICKEQRHWKKDKVDRLKNEIKRAISRHLL